MQNKIINIFNNIYIVINYDVIEKKLFKYILILSFQNTFTVPYYTFTHNYYHLYTLI